MKDSKVERARQGAAMLRRQFLQGDAEAFGRVLGEREVAVVVSELVEPYRERIYPPLDTLRLFVGQVLSADRACQDVAGRRLSERVRCTRRTTPSIPRPTAKPARACHWNYVRCHFAPARLQS